MIIDSYKTLVMEHCSFPGNIGDSCAETSRYKHLKDLLGIDCPEVDLYPFVSATGFLRHPTAPDKDANGDSWRETDFTGDQSLPLFLASKKGYTDIQLKLSLSIQNAGWRTGNGDIVHPIVLSIIKNWKWLTNTCIVAQGLLFKLPWRWSDQYNRFEEIKDSSADYLNYIHAGVYSSWICRKLVSKKTLKQKVRDYYKVEPNSEFLIELYDQVIERYW